MGKYVYRIDKQINFKAINDYTFRAKRWFPDMFPHKTLIEKTKNTLSDEGIYRICFFANFSLANEYVNYLRTKSLLFRCLKSSIVQAGFHESWDDGFAIGDAYLFWCKEYLNEKNERFSMANLPFNDIQIFHEKKWIDLNQYIQHAQ
ncbi:hypothetical protein AB7281_20815 [Providencia rettgeri]|uniref:hypothetical protein n=1 Tax=Providencia sp. PROV019 TaxID=2949754 RepID=UPI00234AAC90|nr:hypothetical protein [Providencia sp. PROV019]